MYKIGPSETTPFQKTTFSDAEICAQRQKQLNAFQ